MKSPSRDHSQPQTVYKIGFASYVYLRFLLSTFILLGLVLHPTSGVSAYEGKATLVIKGSLVCIMHGRIDRQNTEAKIPLQLPKEDGPIEGKGWWRTNSTGYGTGYLTGGGLVVLKGQLRNGFLIFPWPDYYLYGKLQGKPAVPPIRLKAVAGSEFVQQTPYKECKGALVYRLEMPSERWRITVDGWDRLARGDQPHAIPRPRSLGRPSPWTSEPGKSAQVKYDNVSFGLLVHWRMIVDVEIEKGRYKRGLTPRTPYM